MGTFHCQLPLGILLSTNKCVSIRPGYLHNNGRNTCKHNRVFMSIEMANTSRCVTCLSVLVLVEGHSIGAVLVMIDTVFPLLAKFEVLADSSLHHHVLAVTCADTGDITLCIYY